MEQRNGEFRLALEVLKLSEAPRSLDGIRRRHLGSHFHQEEREFLEQMMVVEAAMNFGRISPLRMGFAELLHVTPGSIQVCSQK